MNWPSFLFWGFVANIVFLSIVGLGIGFRCTRLHLPFIFGTIFTTNRDLAFVYGLIFHFIAGFLFALIYIYGFSIVGFSSWWLGLCFGFCHGVFLLAIVLPLLPSLHPRMANEHCGPTPSKLLEPPGFLGLNYGFLTPYFVLVGHMAFGAVMGLYAFRP